MYRVSKNIFTRVLSPLFTLISTFFNLIFNVMLIFYISRSNKLGHYGIKSVYIFPSTER